VSIAYSWMKEIHPLMASLAYVFSAEKSSSPLRVWSLNKSDMGRWDAFVRSCPQATFFHLSGWKDILENVLGHPTFYLYAESSGGIEGVLPLGHVRSRLFGNALISVPFLVYGGVAARTEEARFALEAEAERIALSLGVDYLEMRNLSRRREDWPTKDLYVTFQKALDPDPDENFKAIPRKQRAVVRKGIAAGLASVVDPDVDRFFEAYAASLHNLGTPVLPKRYFAAVKERFGEACEVLTVTAPDGRALSSVLSFYFRDEVLPYYGGGPASSRDLHANDFMYWELMRRATRRGVRLFDYGRSKVGTGSYSFKKNWGFEPEPLRYQYRLVKAGAIPNVSPANKKYRLMVECWKRLPFGVTKRLGPMVARYLA
jgi:FemAB-related protein (PEP-CTERM system-associated)